MTAAKAKRPAARPPPARVTRPATPPAPPPAAPATNGKKKKKKKGKGKGVERSEPAEYDAEDDEEDDESGLPPLPALEPMGGMLYEHARAVGRTGLSPELASVHVSTTASLSASLAAHLKPTTAAEAELLATADHLARSMEGAEGELVNDEYWASFPDHLRNFVRHTYSRLSSPGNADPKTQAMYAIAQQMHSGAARDGGGGGGGGGGRYPPGAYPPGSYFDPAIFADPQFALAMEHAAANGALQGVEGAVPANLVVYPDEGEYGEDEYYSEDEELGDEAGGGAGERRAQAHFTLSFEDAPARAPAVAAAGGEAAGYPAPKKKGKKKKKRGGAAEERAPEETPEETAGARPEAEEGGTVTNGGGQPGTLGTAVSQSQSAPNRMPAARPPPPAAANPPPSSRAAGKKPMAYTPAPATDPPPPSRRAASKAPISSHAYGHNHAHHHPSPPSSNASAPHKPRPPATGQQPPKNNKIWSTSTTEERERIKEFWLALGEDERRNLVKIEKEAVLKKMKEQQKHNCSCAVCGRKRCVFLSSLSEKFS